MGKIGSIKFCKKCGRKTEHIYVGKEAINGDYVALAIFSFGISIIAEPRKKYWKCIECGKIRKK